MMWRETGGPKTTRMQAAAQSPDLPSRPVMAQPRRRGRATAWNPACAIATGYWLIPLAFAETRAAVGDLVVARDPRARDRLLVKRRPVDYAADGDVTDRWRPPERTRTKPSQSRRPTVIGQPWFRYWPARGSGRINLALDRYSWAR
jgi:hypothetical protein